MKKTVFMAAALVAAFAFTSCDKKNQAAAEVPQTTTEQAQPSVEQAALGAFFSGNVGKYPLADLNITTNPVIAEPLKQLLGETRFAEVGSKLTTETPIEAVNAGSDTLQFSVAEPHNVPANNVTVQYITSTGKLRVIDTVDSNETVKE
ncbi:MAG: hypothetical protein Q4A44_02195 [Bacteroidales bacterium]|nr:hypothetical protein [Bacteroidales bacterium]